MIFTEFQHDIDLDFKIFNHYKLDIKIGTK